MPFFKNGKEGVENAVPLDDKANGVIMGIFIESIVPLKIFGDDLSNEDDGKLAYSPFETLPFTFLKDEKIVEQSVWQAGRYIGSTQINGTTIEIKPRFGTSWLAHLLDDIFHIQITKSGESLKEKFWNELMRRVLWSLWVKKFAAADKYGLPRKTVKQNHRGINIRGRLNTYKSIIPLFTKRQVVSEYRERELDDSICNIIYKAYSILVKRKYNKTKVPPQIQDTINSLNGHYQGRVVSVSTRHYQDISYKSIDLSWKPLVDFSWQIIQQDSLFNNKSKTGEGYSIFIDMAEIWEAFLRKKLGEAFSSDGWRVLSVEECHYGIYQDSFFKREIIPDIILQKGDEYIVFDAKYKRMLGRKEDVDRTDLFQIHTYIQYIEHCMGEVVLAGLLYPITDKEFKDSDKNLYHSTNLFGDEKGNPGGNGNHGGNYGKDIRFIIDGIYCEEVINENIDNNSIKKQQDEINKNVAAMIDRIKKIIEEITE